MGNSKSTMRNMNKTVLKTIEVLKMFNNEEFELNLSTIAQRLDIPVSTVHRIVSTLTYSGLMYQNPDNGKYGLGLGCYQIGNNVKISSQLSEVSIPVLTMLLNKYDEVVHILTHDGSGHLMLIKRMLPKRSMAVLLETGTKELQVTASGKCILAYMSNNELEDIIPTLSFKKYTPNSIENAEQLLTSLKHIREQGYATETEECEMGLFCCAAPIFSGNKCVATISISMPFQRLEDEAALIEDIKEASRKITASL